MIRTLTKAELTRNMAAFVALAADVDDWTAANFLADLPEKWRLSFAIWKGKSPIAYAILSRRAEGHVHLHHFMIAKDWRRRTVGTQMLEEVKRRAGPDRLTLKVHYANAAAIRFYQERGFTPTERRGEYWGMKYAQPPAKESTP